MICGAHKGDGGAAGGHGSALLERMAKPSSSAWIIRRATDCFPPRARFRPGALFAQHRPGGDCLARWQAGVTSRITIMQRQPTKTRDRAIAQAEAEFTSG